MGQNRERANGAGGEHPQAGLPRPQRRPLRPSTPPSRGDRHATVAINCPPAQAGKAVQAAVDGSVSCSQQAMQSLCKHFITTACLLVLRHRSCISSHAALAPSIRVVARSRPFSPTSPLPAVKTWVVSCCDDAPGCLRTPARRCTCDYRFLSLLSFRDPPTLASWSRRNSPMLQ